ncbi:PKD domain-containing protein [Lewinella sp. W8]|uniref:PKD domain-containing protein n=1 Tax=Lewinella sp. W8 TaxID=2528208 RepID=UPI0010671B75|nr:PKD domain-containing protein [Lewinella sp. W8]MTB53276.1 PKD domain-containing protein [Lewinella sp. W8]
MNNSIRVLFLTVLLSVVGSSLNAQGQCTDEDSGDISFTPFFADVPGGYYAPGTTVEICYSVLGDFNTPDVEWIHAVLLASAGSGFDFSTLAPSGTPPASCRAAGVWGWYPTWSRCMPCPGGEDTFFNGYAFDSSEGTNDSCGDPAVLDGDPGNNYGDGAGNCGLVFCWTLETVDPGPGVAAADAYEIRIRVLADGVSGGYTGGVGGFCGSPCDSDPFICFPEVGDPSINVLNQPCPGELFQLEAVTEGGIFSGVQGRWEDDAGNVVAVGYNASLPAGNYTFVVGRPGCNEKDVDIELNLTDVTFDFNGLSDGSFFCFGENFTASVSVTGAAINSATWSLNGSTIANGTVLNQSNLTPADAGQYSVVVNFGDGCDTTIFRNYLVGDEVLAEITPQNAEVCINEEITFTATDATTGNPFPSSHIVLWDVTVPGDTYTTSRDFPGVREVTLDVIDEDNCAFRFQEFFTVHPNPEVTITPDDLEICDGETTVIRSSVTGGATPYTYLWGPEETVTTPNYTVSEPYGFTNGLYLLVTDANGCVGGSDFVTIDINPTPFTPLLDCDPICVSEVSFSWNQADADFFELYLSINGGPENLIDDNYTGLSYLVSGLSAGDQVDFRIVPFSGTITDACEGPEATERCFTPLFTDPGWTINFPTTVCAGTAGTSMDIELYTRDAGTILLNSPTLGLTDFPAEVDSVTTLTIPGLTPGQLAEVHDLSLAYAGPGGRCPADTMIQFTALAPAAPDFALDVLDICDQAGTYLANLTTPWNAEGVYNLSVSGAGTVLPLTDSTWQIDLDVAGSYEVRMIAANVTDPNCTDTLIQTIVLRDPPPAPALQCGDRGLDSVVFVWTDTGADSYVVNEVDIPAYAVTEQIGNQFFVRNLMVDDEIQISVTGLSAGCPSATSDTILCRAESCPPIVMSVDPIGPFCANDDQEVPLSITITGSDGSGTLDWQLDGQPIGNSLNPSSLSPGTYNLRANFFEDCEFAANFTLTINPVPTASFSLTDTVVCVDQTLGADAGAVQTGWSYDFTLVDADGTIAPGSNAASRTLSWSTPGTKIIELTVTNEFGCVSAVYRDSVAVVLPLGIPVVSCRDITETSVTFEWAPIAGVDSFSVSIDGGTAFFQDSTYILVDGLGVDQAVAIAVVAYGETPCPDLTPGRDTCRTSPCPAIMLERPEDLSFCLDRPGTIVPLTAVVTGGNGTGMLSFAGDGVTANGTMYQFDATAAGPGSHLIRVTYLQGTCTNIDSFTYTVFETPTSDFTLDGMPQDLTVCVDQEFNFSYVGDVVAGQGAVFTVDFGGAAVTPLAGLEQYTLSFDAPGTYPLSLFVERDGCVSDTTILNVVVEAPLTMPQISCGQTSLTSVEFIWDDQVGVDSFQVRVDGGMPFFQDSTRLVVSGLSDGVTVNIEVIAFGSSTCGNSEPGEEDCSSDPCPTIVVTPPDDADFCLATPGNETVLAASQSGGVGNGNFTFSGPGVYLDNGTWRFHADSAGVGTHTLTAVYRESICSDSAQFTFRVFTPPTSPFTQGGVEEDITVCVGEVFPVAYVGNVADGDNATFSWEFDGANTSPTAGFETYDLSFDAPGVYTLSLSIVRDGCSSEVTSHTVTVEAPLGTPELDCTDADLNSVLVTWNTITGAVGYEVNVAGTLDTVLSPSYTVSNLLPGASVTLEVRALGAGVCGDGTASTPITCSADPCPPLSPDFTALVQEICLETGDEFILLSDLIVTGGSGVGATYTFTGPGVSQDTFFAAVAGGSLAGIDHQIVLDYVEEGPCGLQVPFSIRVISRPEISLTDPGDICVDNLVDFSFTASEDVTAGDLTIDWDGGQVMDDGNPDDLNFTLSYSTPGTRTIRATLISPVTGCASEPLFLTVNVIAPLLDPVPFCSDEGLETLTFRWDTVVGATAYEITHANGSPTETITDNFYVVTGLRPDESYTISVRALGPPPCGNSEAIPVTCTTLPCPGGVVQSDTPDTDICLDGTEAAFLLAASLDVGSPTGPFVWSGTGVVDNGDGTYSFDPAGLAAGAYVLTVDYLGEADCTSRDEVTVRLFDLPVVSFSATPSQLCPGETLTVSFTGTAEPGATYAWDFGDANVTDLGGESYSLSWDTPGDRTVRLRVTDNCVNEASFSLVVEPFLAVPQPSCVRQDLDGVLFSWPVIPEATEGYRVSINGGEFGPLQQEAEYYVSDLDFGESVSIRVMAVRSGTPCNDSEASASVSCAARLCPTVTFAPAATQTTFCDDETEAVALRANLAGDDGTGDLSWAGAGVGQNPDGSWGFDPVAAGLGDHQLTVTYVQEGLCVYQDVLIMQVNAVPDPAFSLADDLVCSGSETTVSYLAGFDAETNFSWDFGEGQATAMGNESYRVSWSTAGAHTVSLVVERRGCVASFELPVMVEAPPVAGNVVADDLQFCVGTATPVSLAAQLAGGDAGGVWTVASGSVPGGALNGNSGNLNPQNLAPGAYSFTYTVNGTVCPQDEVDVLVEMLAAPVANAGDDQTITCNMGMVSLNGSNSEQGSGYTYSWSADDASVMIMDADQLMIDVGQPATYTLEVTNAFGCSSTDEVLVDAELEAPVLEVELSQITCFQADDGAIRITGVNGGRAPYTYSLNGEDRGSSTLMAGLQPDQYDLTVTDVNGCFSTILLDLTEPDQLSVQLQFPGDTSIVNEGEEIFISAAISGGNAIDTLIWQPDSISNMDGQSGIQFIARETQMISVTVVDELGCRASDNQMLLVRQDRPVYFPTAFSPNGDDVNDIYFIGANDDQVVEIRDFFIFDRWGEAVFTAGIGEGQGSLSSSRGFPPNDPNFGWDGTLNGQPMNPQVFVYTATVVFEDGQVLTFKGDFVLMR